MNEENKIVRVFSGIEIEVNLLKNELDKIGVACLIKNENNSGIMAGFFGGGATAIDLFILASDQEKAEPLIKEFTQRNEE